MPEEENNEEPQEEEEELSLEEAEEEDDEYEYVYGIALPKLPEDMQPLECVVIIEGIMMSTGQPTITAIGSEGMRPWTAAGALQMEAARLINGYTFGGMGTGFFEEEEEEDEDDDDF